MHVHEQPDKTYAPGRTPRPPQRTAADAGIARMPAAVHRTAVDHMLGSPGQPVAAPLREEMEARLGADFSQVRVHTDDVAAASAAMLGARAYTVGNHVVIGPGAADRRTLAHELTHVIQQRQGPVGGTDHGSGLRLSDPSDQFERAAEATAERALRESRGAGQASVALGTQRLADQPAINVPFSFSSPGAGPAAAPTPWVQRMPANKAFTRLIEQQAEVSEDTYPEIVERKAPIAFIINTILPFSEVESIPRVLEGMLKGLTGFKGRIAVVLGINAPTAKAAELEKAAGLAGRLIARLPYPVAIVQSTFTGKKFPFGRMRNAVMHSPETRQLTQAFVAQNLHPYIAVQDFDAGSRAVRSGVHVFNFFEERTASGSEGSGIEESRSEGSGSEGSGMEESGSAESGGGQFDWEPLPPIRPLLMIGGYRVDQAQTETLVADTIARFKRNRKKVPDKLTNPAKRDQFLEEFGSAITLDMKARQNLALLHPLLPYAPEPNLYIDALLPLLSEDIAFGEGAAEFTQLGKMVHARYASELEQFFIKEYNEAPDEVPVPDQRQPPEPFLEDDQAMDLGEEEPEMGWPTLELEKADVQAQIDVEGQNLRHPMRDQGFLADFIEGSIVTDLSRLAYEFLETGRILQSHDVLTPIADRLAETKKGKQGLSLSKYRKKLKLPGDAARSQQGKPYNPPFTDPRLTGIHDQSPVPWSFPREYQGQLGSTAQNTTSSAIFSSFTMTPFSGLGVGVRPEHIPFVLHAAALAPAKYKFMWDLSQILGRRVGGTPIDGNCLYHAVNQARGVPEPGLAAASADLRRRVTEYILSHLDTVANYAAENVVEINDLLDCVSRNGNWAGDEGDLVPRIIASVLDTTIVICQQGSEDLPVWPLEGGPGTGEITVYLDNDHYSVDPPLELERKKSKKSK